MDSSDQDLISMIYQSAVDPSNWPEVAKLLAASFKTHQSILIRSPGDEIAPHDVITFGIDTDCYERYVEILDEDLWLRGMLELMPGSTCRGDQFVPLREYKRKRFFQLLCVPSNAAYMGGAVVKNESGNLLLFACQRCESLGSFGGHEIEHIRAISKHLDRANFIGQRIAALQRSADSLQSILDKSPYGVVVVDEYSSVTWCNSVAENIFRSNDGLTLRNYRICTSNVTTQQALQSCLSDAISTSCGIGVTPGGYISVSRPSQRRPYQVTICPISKSNHWGTAAFAVLFLLDTDNPPDIPIEAFRKLFSLTRAEARVSKALVKGLSVQEVAECFKVSPNTIRTQVKSILRKCNVRSQSELLQLLARVVTTGSS